MKRVAIVSGHSRGLGAAIAADLLARGIIVHGIARQPHPTLAGRPGYSESALDLADAAALAAWLDSDALATLLTGADQALLINNAGVVTPVGPAGRQGAAALARAVAVNVSAPLQLSDAFVAASDACPDRRIAHVSSGAGRSPYPGWSAYCATKAALDMHAAASALDAIARLRIASVAPGVIDTDMQAQIRAADPADFPRRARFEALKREQGLSSPADAARRFNDYLLSPSYGTHPITDLRD
ncbi:SDR family oxidoreductase [Massilia sp. TS11]|uniref:SDR family oxidoreductase n=1 Tax=Massilia sp. TS11 TaxID=2908003 RepID=UPI001EDC55B6|nr:SDR family oxidoreductase [Massilia sp. TS11]MCG2586894.1 SDR family oxidoreductase [Massilia sp. TS11]